MKQKLKGLTIPVLINLLVINTAIAAQAYDKIDLEDFSCKLFNWSQYIIIPIVVTIFIIAGIAYMTSGGNPNRVSFAKKLITGGVSAILVLYLGKFFLTVVVGIDWFC